MPNGDVTLRLVTERILLCALQSQDAAEVASVARQRAEFLAAASLQFGASLDEELTWAAIAGLALPGSGTWAILDVVDHAGKTLRVAIVHPEDEPTDRARALVGRWIPDPDDPIGIAAIAHDRATRIVSAGANALLLAAGARHPEMLRVIQQLGVGSLLIVPITASDVLLGAITYVRRGHIQPFGSDDLALAEALAERCGQALQSARLFGAARAAQAEAVDAQEDAVTARTIAEAALADALSARAAAEAARVEAQTANASKAQFLATMSHELRTPLNAIGGYAQIMEMGIHGPVTPEQSVDLVNIQRSQVHLLGLVESVLSYAQLEAGHIVYNITDLILRDELPGLLALIAPQIREKHLVYTCADCDPALRVRGDPDKMRQILLNLLGNATKFTAPGGTISLTCTDDPWMIYVHVSDDGIGIPGDRLGSVFEPFVQVNRGFTTSSVGVGLGLAISRELARAMGGDLTAASEEGHGSVFSMSLPRA
ncbi:MAG: ATP-binding region ATPase domain protein [Gemmatimonadetes bacterium]|nr:ATP-binding region ATPase domain protein [Gemmatimonadota bacterium]